MHHFQEGGSGTVDSQGTQRIADRDPPNMAHCDFNDMLAFHLFSVFLLLLLDLWIASSLIDGSPHRSSMTSVSYEYHTRKTKKDGRRRRTFSRSIAALISIASAIHFHSISYHHRPHHPDQGHEPNHPKFLVGVDCHAIQDTPLLPKHQVHLPLQVALQQLAVLGCLALTN